MSDPTLTVLVTGFEPFGTDSTNPSWQAVQQLAADWADDDVRLVVEQVPCVYGAAIDTLRAAVLQHRPDVVVAFGQAGGRAGITPERVAINMDDARIPDNAGQSPVDTPVVTGGPAAYFTGLPVKACVRALHEAGIPAEVSQTAGTFVCNHIFYGLMNLVATEHPQLRAGFVHVPFSHEQVADRPGVPSLSLATMSEAAEIVVRTCLTTSTDVVEAGGALS